MGPNPFFDSCCLEAQSCPEGACRLPASPALGPSVAGGDRQSVCAEQGGVWTGAWVSADSVDDKHTWLASRVDTCHS